MNKKEKVLFIVPGYFNAAPRGIRIKNICNYLKNYYDIDILAFKYKDNEIDDDLNYHLLDFSFISKLINKNIFFTKIKKNFILNKVIGLLIFFIQKLTFPDHFSIESRKIFKKIVEIHTKKRFEHIVIVSYPFSLLELTKKIKELDSNLNFVVDIGDPLANNSAYSLTPKLKEKFISYEEKNLLEADSIIVTNEETKNYYKNNYNKLRNIDFFVIPQGANIDNSIPENFYCNKETKKILIYAGIFYKKLREPYNLFESIIESNDKFILDIYGQPNIYNLNSKEINFKGRIEHKEIQLIYKNCDILVFIDNAFGIQTSGKIFELLGQKKPILFIYTNDKSSTYQLVKNLDFVFTVKNNKADILKTLNLIYNKNTFSFNLDTSLISWERRAFQYSEIFQQRQGVQLGTKV